MTEQPDPRAEQNREHRLHGLTEALRERLEKNAPVDREALAREHDLPVEDVDRCLAAVQALLGPGAPAREAAAGQRSFPPVVPDVYEVLEEIGRGGMGIVYKARQRSLGRIVALKVLRFVEMPDAPAVERFRREAQTLARLRHPHIVSVHDIGESAGSLYFTMDWIEGTSLEDRIRERRLSAPKAVTILRQVADAVAHAHDHGIIHRDLKPSNIIVDREGSACVVDFGLASDSFYSRDLTRTGHVVGSPAYMSPEQAEGATKRIGPATDIYALGAVLYECITGEPPFRGASLAEVLRAVTDTAPRPPRRLVAGVPRDLETMCLKALEKSPRRRYRSVREMVDDLERFADGRSVKARPLSLAGVALRTAVRHRAGLATGVGIGLVLALLWLVAVAPWIPALPGSRFATARNLEELGEHEAAAATYESLAEGPPLFLTGFTRRDVLRRWLGCCTKLAPKLVEEGRSSKARLELARVVETVRIGGGRSSRESWPEWPEVEEALWMLVGVQSLDGAPHSAETTLKRLVRLLGRKGLRSNVAFHERVLQMARDVTEDTPHVRRHAISFALAYPFSLESHGVWLGDAFRGAGPRELDLLVEALGHIPRVRPDRVSSDYAFVATAWLLRELPGRDFRDALARGIESEDLAEVSREYLAHLLCQSADLPFRLWIEDAHSYAGAFADLEFPIPFWGVTPGDAARLWREIRDLPPKEAYRLRVARAVERHSQEKVRALRRWIEGWLRDHTALLKADVFTAPDPPDLRPWWEVRKEDDPVTWLTSLLGIDAPRGPDDFGELIRLARHFDELRNAPRLYYLAALSVPPAEAPPIVDRELIDDEAFYLACQRQVEGAVLLEPHVVRLARVDFPAAEDAPRLEWQTVFSLSVGDETTVELPRASRNLPWSPRSPPGLRISSGSLHLPGSPFVDAVVPREEPRAEEVRKLEVRVSWEARGPGAVLLTGRWKACREGLALGQILRPQQTGPEVRSLRLCALFPPGSSTAEWSLEDWMIALQQSVRRIVHTVDEARETDERERAQPEDPSEIPWWSPWRYRGHRLTNWIQWPVESLLRLGHVFPLQDLDTLEDAACWALEKSHDAESPCRESLLDLETPARVLAGDRAPLEDGTFDAWCSKGESPWYFWRLSRVAEDATLRKRALEELAKLDLSRESADYLHAAFEGRSDLPAALRENVARVRWDRTRRWWENHGAVPGGVAAVYLTFGFCCLLLLWRRRGVPTRMLAASLLVLLGMGMVVFNVGLSGWSLLPDALGWGAAAVGAWMVARLAGSEGRGSCVVVVVFLLGAAASLLAENLPGIEALRWLLAAAGALAFLSMPRLVGGLDRRYVRRAWVFYAAVVLGALALLSPRVSNLGEIIEGPQFLLLSLWTAAGLLPLLATIGWRLDLRRRKRLRERFGRARMPAS